LGSIEDSGIFGVSGGKRTIKAGVAVVAVVATI
jgi:hypothetical protein